MSKLSRRRAWPRARAANLATVRVTVTRRPRLADLPGDSDPGPVTGAGPTEMPAGGPGPRPRPGPLSAWPWDPGGQPEAALRLPAAARRAARVTRCQCIARASGGGTARAND
jgi:hypothetical protein